MNKKDILVSAAAIALGLALAAILYFLKHRNFDPLAESASTREASAPDLAVPLAPVPSKWSGLAASPNPLGGAPAGSRGTQTHPESGEVLSIHRGAEEGAARHSASSASQTPPTQGVGKSQSKGKPGGEGGAPGLGKGTPAAGAFGAPPPGGASVPEMQALLKTARAATANLDVPQLANLGRLLASGSPAAATAKIQKALALAQRFDRVNKEASILDEQYNAKREALQAALTSHSGQEGAIRQDLAAIEQGIQSKTAQQQSAQRALEAVTGKAPPLSAEEMRMPAFPGVSGAARIALQTAYAQMGKPYVWGGSGPSSFDCSGLVRYSWHAAGVEMPHLASAQAQLFPKVPTSALQPGDLVYFGNPVHHVGMYIGNGKMINAPHPGDVVRTAPALQGDYVGGNRP